MTLAPPPAGLPKAYGGCTCSCHRVPGIMHMAPCCTPSLDGMSDEWLIEKEKAEEGSDVSAGPVAALPSSSMEVVAKLRERAGFMRDAGHDDDADLDLDAATTLAAASATIKGLEARVAELERVRGELAYLHLERDQGDKITDEKLADAEGRSAKHWQAFRDLRTAIIGDGPMCRDCADFDGRCQGDGRPCDPDEAVAEQLAEWKAAEAERDALRRVVAPFVALAKAIDADDPETPDNLTVAARATDLRGNAVRVTLGHLRAARKAMESGE